MRTFLRGPLPHFLFSAVILGVAMNFPQTLGWLSLVALVPILAKLKTHPGQHLFGMFLFGVVFALISTSYFLATYPLSWLSITSPLVSIVIIGGIWVSISLAIAIPTTFWPLLTQKFGQQNSLSAAFIAASVWVLLEYSRSWLIALSIYGEGTLFGPHHTYYALGYTVAHIPVLRDMLAVGGIYLASFFVILSNYTLYAAYTNYREKQHLSKESRNMLGICATIAILSFGVMFIIRAQQETPPGTVNVSIISTYFPSGTRYTAEHRALALRVAPGGVGDLSDIVISPEGFQIDQIFLAPPPEDSTQVFIGTTGASNGKTMYFHEYKTRAKQYHDKQILMPIGDYRLVWTDLFLKSTQTESWFDGYYKKFSLDEKQAQEKVPVFKRENSPLVIAGTTCSENISPYIYREGVQHGATLLLNIASHAPFHGSQALSRQTLSLNTSRALESGRSLVVSSNFDKSFIIADIGKIEYQSTSTDQISYATREVELHTYLTPYTRLGNYILVIALAILMCLFYTKRTK